jgi:hypothetical protein
LPKSRTVHTLSPIHVPSRDFPGRRIVPIALAIALVVVLLASGVAVWLAERSGQGALFGADAVPTTGQSQIEAFEGLQERLGRSLDAVRLFYRWDSSYDTALQTTPEGWAAAAGKVPIVSVKSLRSDGSPVPWSEIANATPGTPLYDEMATWADRMGAWPGTVYFSFNHEPSTKLSLANGTADEYVAAWRTMWGIFQDRGVTNVRWTWIMGAPYPWEVASGNRSYAPSWYPGDDYVDVLGADVYNWSCTGAAWRSFSSLTHGFLAFARQHPGEQTMVAEYGTPENPTDPMGKADWLTEAGRAVQRWPGFVAFVAFDAGDGSCSWRLDSSPSSLEAARSLAARAFFGG